MKQYVKTYEQFSADLNEGVIDFIKKSLDKGAEFAKSVWDTTKRESRETQEAVRLIGLLAKGEKISDEQKKFVKEQAKDLVKILPLIAVSSIPIPVPITPFLIMLGKKVGFNILPEDSFAKAGYTK
jgi:hypothetical protein